MSEQEIKSYDVPVPADFTQETATAELKKIHTDAGGNSLHPYSNPHHPQHKDFVKAVTKLHEIKSPEPAAEMTADGAALVNPTKPAIVKVMSEGLEIAKNQNAAIQAERFTEAHTIMDELTKLNFERQYVPADISQRKIDIWKLQLLAEKKDYGRLIPQLGKALQKMRVPANVQRTFQTLEQIKDTDSAEFRQKEAEDIIEWISAAQIKAEKNPPKGVGVAFT